MARRPAGSVLERHQKAGITFALRFPAYGKRRFIVAGHDWAGYTRADAEQALKHVMSDVERGIWQPPRLMQEGPREPEPVPTLHEFASAWFDRRLVLGELRDATQARLRWEIGHLVRGLADWTGREPRSLRLDEITAERVELWLVAAVRDGLARSSVKKIGGLLVALLDLGEEYGHITRNIARGPVRRFKASAPRRTSIDSAAGVAALLEAARDLDLRHDRDGTGHTLISILAFTGVRISEALGLRWCDVRLADGYLVVNGTKTEASPREVDLLPPLRATLATLKARRAPEPDGLLITTTRGTKWDRRNASARLVRPAVDEASQRLVACGRDPLPQGISAHSLRRTYASAMAALGQDARYVMEQLGHTDPGFTFRVYAQQMKRRDGELDRLRALFAGDVTAARRLDAFPPAEAVSTA